MTINAARRPRAGRSQFEIRLAEIAHAWRHERNQAFGLDAADLVVIGTDGAWEQADSIKTAYDVLLPRA